MVRFAFAVAIGVALSACSLLVSTSDLSSGGPSGPDASSSSSSSGGEGGASSSSGSIDAATQDGATTDGGSGAHCPTGKGATMVDTGVACIDSTEITQAQYDDFLAEGVTASTQAARCAFNSTFTPDNTDACINTFTPKESPAKPVVCVNWCDVSAYCTWAGKRVCHGDEWIGACTKNHTQQYPYPGDFNKNNCNGPDKGIGAPVSVGSLATCEGGYKGLFDMAGNVTELEGDCPGDQCNRRGGSFDSSSAAKCEFLLTGPLGFHTPFVGGRCCADRH